MSNSLTVNEENEFLTIGEVTNVNKNAQEAAYGSLLFGVHFQVDPVQVLYFRQVRSLWESLALIGGFTLSMYYAGLMFYRIVRNNSNYVLSQQFMTS